MVPTFIALLSALPAGALCLPWLVSFSRVALGLGRPVALACFVAALPAAPARWPARVAAWPCGCGRPAALCVCPSLAVFVPTGDCLPVWLPRVPSPVPPVPPAPGPLAPALSAVAAACAAAPAGSAVRVGVVGSRSFSSLALVRSFVAALPAGVVVVSGGAGGVDRVAASAAAARGLEVSVFPAAWSLGRAAGVVRNAPLVRSCALVVAFWDGVSAGTGSAVSLARSSFVPVFVVAPPVAAGAPVQSSLF